jgi:hypothetical protein
VIPLHASRGRSFAVLGLVVGAALVAACLFPSDLSNEVVVTVDQETLVLSVGDSLQLGVQVARSGRSVSGAVIVYGTTDSGVVLVTPQGLVRAVGTGVARISVEALGYANATVAELPVQVKRAIRIADVLPERAVPNEATWGELLTIVGTGLDPADAVVFVGTAAARVEGFVPGDSADPLSTDTLRVWTPALVPEQSNLVVARLTGTGAGAQWPLRVLQRDILEPNEQNPRLLDVSAPLFRPDLALEVRPQDGSPSDCASVWVADQGECWYDWYSFLRPNTPATDSVTIVLRFPQVLDNTPVSIEIGEVSESPLRWLLSRNFSLCTDDRAPGFISYVITHEFATLRDSFVVALADLNGRRISLSATLFGVDRSPEVPWPGRPTGTIPYELQVLPGYVSERPPDLAEENDQCHLAYELNGNDTLALTFDNGTDIDWFHFTVPAALPGGPQADVVETEPNNTVDLADTVSYGDRVTGEVAPAGDVDYYTFYADSGATLDLEVVASRNGSSLNSLLFLMNDDGLVAWNNDFLASGADSRVTVSAPRSGWYWFYVTDYFLRGGASFYYTVAVSAQGGTAAFLTAEVCCGSGGGQFDPQIQLWSDTRATESGITPLEERPGLLEVPVLPGEYLLLVYNRAGDAMEYQLRMRLTTGGAPAPLATSREVPLSSERIRWPPPRRSTRH